MSAKSLKLILLTVLLFLFQPQSWALKKNETYHVYGGKMISLMVSDKTRRDGSTHVRIDYDIPEKHGNQDIYVIFKETDTNLVVEEHSFSASGKGSKILKFDFLNFDQDIFALAFIGYSYAEKIEQVKASKFHINQESKNNSNDTEIHTAFMYEVKAPIRWKRGENNQYHVRYEIPEDTQDARLLMVLKTSPQNSLVQNVLAILNGKGELIVNVEIPDQEGQEYILDSYIGEHHRNRIDKLDSISLFF